MNSRLMGTCWRQRTAVCVVGPPAKCGVTPDRIRSRHRERNVPQLPEFSHQLGRCGPRARRELEVVDLLERELPARTGVFEGADLDLERCPYWDHRRDRDRCPPRIEQPAAVPDLDVAELARDEVRICRRVRIEVIDLVGHAATADGWPSRDPLA